MSERWLVAMSGGVDSSVAAALLARAGHEVVGVTMDLGQGLGGQPLASGGRRCCGLPDAEDAREVAAAQAAPKPTAPATFSVPARRPRSWEPPRSRAVNGAPGRT